MLIEPLSGIRIRQSDKSHFNQREKEMEAYEAESKSTENAGKLRKRGKRDGIGGWREERSLRREDQQSRGNSDEMALPNRCKSLTV